MIELLEQQRKLTANQWKLTVTGNLADLLDYFDFFLIGYALAFITKEWQLTYWQGAMILVSSGLGAVPGAFFWGWVADNISRRKVFISAPLGRMEQPDDIAPTAVYLASSDSKYMTGETLLVSGCPL
jgi:putative MFS transporter